MSKQNSLLSEDIEFLEHALNEHGIVSKTDSKGVITYVNDKFCEVTGYSKEELIGSDHSIINSKFHSKEFITDLWKTIQSGQTWRGKIRNQKKNGDYYWVRTTIIPKKDENNKVIEYLSIREEITKAVELEKLSNEVQEIAKIGGWEFDVEKMEAHWNPQTYRIHEVDPSEPVPLKEALSFYAPHERERIGKMVEECLSEGKSYQGDFEFITAKKNKIWVRAIGKANKDKNGKVVKMFGTFQDITKQKENEIELQDSRTYLALALEGAGLGVWDWDLRDNSVRFDERWGEMLGLKFNEIEMELSTWEKRVHPDDLEKCYADIKAYMDGKTDRYENVHRMKHKDGHWVYILDRGRFSGWDSDGKPIRFTGTHLDVTATYHGHEEKLKEFREMLSSTPSCLKVVSKNGELLDMNRQGLDLIEAEDFKSVDHANVYDIVEESHRQKFIDFNEKICSGNRGDLIFEIIGLKGTRRWMETYAAPYQLPNGEMAHIAITNEITEKVLAEKEIEKQKAIAQHHAKLASIGEVAAGVAHEINNPLAIMKTYLFALEKKFTGKENIPFEEIKKSNEKMNYAIDRISKIVKGLRTFSRSDTEDVGDFNLVGALKESIDLVKEIFAHDGVELKHDFDANKDEFIVFGNRGKFQQILFNLFNNAKDAMQEMKEKRISISLQEQADSITIHVQDNGVGIPKDIIDKIFDPFFTTKEVNKGTGIGLSMVYNFMEEFKGRVEIDSKENQGTTFKLTFPLNKEKNSSKAS